MIREGRTPMANRIGGYGTLVGTQPHPDKTFHELSVCLLTN